MLTTVAWFLCPWDAHIVRGLLQSEDVPAFLVSEHHVWAKWPISVALGGVRIRVPPSYAVRAREILRARIDGEYERALESEFSLVPEACPQCGSRELATLRSVGSVALAILFTVAVMVPFPPEASGKRCKSCNHVFKPL